jgi:hypothetical protein
MNTDISVLSKTFFIENPFLMAIFYQS